MAKTEVAVEEKTPEVAAFDWSVFVKKPSERAQMNLALFYGPPGGGKTYTAASASLVPELSPVLIIDTEGSTYGAIKQYDDENIDIIPVTKHESFVAVLDALFAGELPRQYKTVIIDTLDVAQDRAKKYFDEVAPLGRSGEPDSFWVWGTLKDWVLDIADQFRKADFLGILVLHLKRETLDSGKVLDQVSLVGSAKDLLPGLPDIVAYVERNDLVTTAWFEASHNRVSKNRHGLPEQMEDPSFSKIIEFVNTK